MVRRSLFTVFQKRISRFSSSTNDVKILKKYQKLSKSEQIAENDLDFNNFSKYVIFYKNKNFHFTFYGIFHGNIQGKTSSGLDCVELMKNKKMDYALLELCTSRLNNVVEQLLKNDTKFENTYSKFSYLPRIHNGFLQNEFLPVVQFCKKENVQIFPCDRNMENVKNRLDSKLLYDTQAYKRFFTYCVESISLRHYPFDQFISLYSQYAVHKKGKGTEGKDKDIEQERGKEEKKGKGRVGVGRKDGGINQKEAHEEVKEQEGRKEANVYIQENNVTYKSEWEDIESLKKLDLLKFINERLKVLSKPSYDVLITEKCKYMSHEILGFLLNNALNSFENNSEHSKNIIIVCSANIIHILKEELHNAFANLENKMNASESSFIFENEYNSYNEYIKPHWPLIFIKYYFIPYFLLYFLLNMLYAFFSLIYKANFQTDPSFSPKIIEVKV